MDSFKNITYTKGFLCVFFTAFLFSCNESVEEVTIPSSIEADKTVLFIGNSYSNFHSMPEMVRLMAASVDQDLSYLQHTPDNTLMIDHANSTELATKIEAQNWDFVTIQTQSIESALSEEHIDANVYPHILNVVEKIGANGSTSVPLYFMTWGREFGASDFCDDLPYMCTFEGMNEVVKERYLFYMNETMGEVSPCAEVWKVIRERYPDMVLYQADGSHPSVLGSYAVALSFYTMIFKDNPMLVTYHREILDESDEQIIREVVKEVVYDRILEWQSN